MEFKNRTRKDGRSVVITVPYQYVIDGIVKIGQKYKIKMEEINEDETLA